MTITLYVRSNHPEIDIVYSTKNTPAACSPVLICGFPGSGYVGKLAVDHLIHELDATHLADIYSTSFPAQLLIKSDGYCRSFKKLSILFKCVYFLRSRATSA